MCYIIKEHFPKAKIVYTKKDTHGLAMMVLNKEVDAAIDNLLPFAYLLKEKSFDNKLEIAYSLYSETLSSF